MHLSIIVLLASMMAPSSSLGQGAPALRQSPREYANDNRIVAGNLVIDGISAAIQIPNLDTGGSHDASGLLQEAVEWASRPEATVKRVQLPCGVLKLSRGLVVESSAVELVGCGADMSHDAGEMPRASTTLAWFGVAGETMVSFQSPSDSRATKRNNGGMSRIKLDGRSTADVGLQVTSWNAGRFQQVTFYNTNVAALRVGTVCALSEAPDSQWNHFDQITVRQYEARPGSAGFVLDGCTEGNQGNASFNTFTNFGIGTLDGPGVDIVNADNNLFINGSIRSTKPSNSVFFRGTYDSKGVGANSNTFVRLTTTRPPLVAGSAGGKVLPFGNRIISYDKGNGSPDPTFEAGATPGIALSFDGSDLVSRAFNAAGSTILAEAPAQVGAARAAAGVETLRIVNGSEAHALLETPGGAEQWSIAVGTSIGLRVAPLVSSNGRMNVPNGLSVGSLQVRMGSPSSSRAACEAGHVMFDKEYWYACVAKNTWRRTRTGADW